MFLDWQNIAVGVIFVVVVAWLVRAVMGAFAARKYSKCGTCDDASCPYSMHKEKESK